MVKELYRHVAAFDKQNFKMFLLGLGLRRSYEYLGSRVLGPGPRCLGAVGLLVEKVRNCSRDEKVTTINSNA